MGGFPPRPPTSTLEENGGDTVVWEPQVWFSDRGMEGAKTRGRGGGGGGGWGEPLADTSPGVEVVASEEGGRWRLVWR